MANEANKNERTSLDDRRNNLRERIANDVGARIDRKKRLNANASKSKEDGPKGKKAYIEDEKEFEKSISKLSPEEIKQKRLERIPYLEQLYRKLKISEYFLVERSRQLYHNISGEIPQFFRRPKIDEKTFNKTLGKGLSKAERKEKYDNYKTLSEEEIKDFEGKVDAKKELLPSIPLDAGRYKEFATLEEKEIYEENQATMKKALEKLKEEHPDEYKKEMDKRAKEETARQKERDKIFDEFYGRIKVVEESIKSEREYSRAELEKKIARLNEKIYSSAVNTDFSKESAELDEENRAINAKYKEQLEFLENHTEDLWTGKYEAFTGDKKKFLDLYLSTNKESIEKDAIKKALKDELYNGDYSSEEYDSAVDEYNEKLAFLDENFDKLKIADYEDLNNRWKAKKAEEKKQEAERKNAPTNKKVVDLKWQMETDLLETCNATNLYASTRLQYGLNYASDHHARIDRSILMPALDELSELTVISHDIDAEYNKQNVVIQNDIKTHQKAKPWIIAKWLGVPRWKKWEKRNNELEAKKADLDTLVQKVAEQKQIISQYVTGLKNAGVSQAMIDRCTTYDIAVANNQITEDEITAEVLNCKEQFKKKIISLNQEGKKQEIANIYESRVKCLNNGPDNMRQIRDGVLTKEEMAELYPEKQDSDETKIASTNPALRTELIDTGEMPTNEALYQDFLYDFEKDPATTGAVDQYIEEVQKTVDVGDIDKYFQNAPTGESTENDKLDENLYAGLAKRINERKAQEEKNIVNQEESSKNIVNKEKNIVNTESEINSKNAVEQNTASPEALAFLKNIRGKMISINEEAIFADEYEFFEKMGAFDVPKIKTDADLQNSLGKDLLNKSELSKIVKENDSKQLEKESVKNEKDSITNNQTQRRKHMSTYTIDNKTFELVNPLSADDIRDENYEHALNLIDRFKKSPEYKGQTVDELFDIVIAKYREDTIEYIADERTKSHFADQHNNYSHKLHDELSKMSKAYFADFENQHKQANIKVAEKWGLKSAKQLNDNVFEYLLGDTLLHDEEGLEYLKNFANKRSFNSEDVEKYPALAGNEHMISELQEKANAIIEYCEEYGFVDVTAEDYAREKMPKNFEKEVFQKSEVYLNTQELLKQEKKEYYNNEKAELQQTFKSSLSGTKDLYLNAKTQLKNILQARDDLANRYYKTSWLSRVARWMPFISRESSEAGRLQNEIDKIDNAIKEVGIDNELVNAVKAEMKAEKLAIKKEVKNNEKEVVSVAETLNLQENIKDATVNKGVSDNRKIEENKELNQEKVIHYNNEFNNKLQK